ncbi:hypothetical protein CERSUDRAFT_90002 [Gelatoporia subvermispora B]|uniref:Uncharacterized protein n=1 Tax=Ceriporiopsis subvermispora (strain B) TaxID=914234 RepID=M2RSN0_CERS8|nr:hypothetical protein CERSUDRAFT_90002 [Gelatoporia subvermispora B]
MRRFSLSKVSLARRSNRDSIESTRRTSLESAISTATLPSDEYLVSLPIVNLSSSPSHTSRNSYVGEAELLDDDNLAWGPARSSKASRRR